VHRAIAPPLLLCLASLAVAVRAGEAEATGPNETGIRHLHAGRAVEAASAFEQALRHEPGSPVLERNLAAAVAALAELRRKDRRPAEAIQLLDRAVELHPERLRYRVLRGRARFEAGRDIDRLFAAEDFRFVLDRDPDHLDALVNLGQIDYAERRLTDAVRSWRRALELRPTDMDVKARLTKAERELAVEGAYEQITTLHFRLRYAATITPERAGTVLRLCEEAYGDLTTRFGSHPKAAVVVTLYTPAEFRSATRMHGWVAGLSDGTIRLTVRAHARTDDLRATVYHELAHHLIRGIAPSAPVWLHEGLAQIAEAKSVDAAEARLARAEAPRPAELGARILRQDDPRLVSRFYDLVLGFTSFLRRQHGDPSMQALLRELGEDVPEADALLTVYGSTRADLFERWTAGLPRPR
jgi:tetratricopeptide (TPR) repeat protein